MSKGMKFCLASYDSSFISIVSRFGKHLLLDTTGSKVLKLQRSNAVTPMGPSTEE